MPAITPIRMPPTPNTAASAAGGPESDADSAGVAAAVAVAFGVAVPVAVGVAAGVTLGWAVPVISAANVNGISARGGVLWPE